jgi:hypothetical protein
MGNPQRRSIALRIGLLLIVWLSLAGWVAYLVIENTPVIELNNAQPRPRLECFKGANHEINNPTHHRNH